MAINHVKKKSNKHLYKKIDLGQKKVYSENKLYLYLNIHNTDTKKFQRFFYFFTDDTLLSGFGKWIIY